MNIKGIIEAQILNCFSPEVSFNAKPRAVKEELSKADNESLKQGSRNVPLGGLQKTVIIVSRFEIIYAVRKMWDRGFYIDPDKYTPLSLSPKKKFWSDIYPDWTWTKKENRQEFEDDVDNLLKSLTRRHFIRRGGTRGTYTAWDDVLSENEWKIITYKFYRLITYKW